MNNNDFNVDDNLDKNKRTNFFKSIIDDINN